MPTLYLEILECQSNYSRNNKGEKRTDFDIINAKSAYSFDKQKAEIGLDHEGVQVSEG